jgi:hypothetical protein
MDRETEGKTWSGKNEKTRCKRRQDAGDIKGVIAGGYKAGYLCTILRWTFFSNWVAI